MQRLADCSCVSHLPNRMESWIHTFFSFFLLLQNTEKQHAPNEIADEQWQTIGLYFLYYYCCCCCLGFFVSVHRKIEWNTTIWSENCCVFCCVDVWTNAKERELSPQITTPLFYLNELFMPAPHIDMDFVRSVSVVVSDQTIIYVYSPEVFFLFDFISPNFTSILNWFLFRSIPLSMSHWTTHTHNIKTNRDSRSTLIIFLNANAWNFYAMRRCAFNSTDTKIDSEKIRNSARHTD